jgi:hypothetical protein
MPIKWVRIPVNTDRLSGVAAEKFATLERGSKEQRRAAIAFLTYESTQDGRALGTIDVTDQP